MLVRLVLPPPRLHGTTARSARRTLGAISLLSSPVPTTLIRTETKSGFNQLGAARDRNMGLAMVNTSMSGLVDALRLAEMGPVVGEERALPSTRMHASPEASRRISRSIANPQQDIGLLLVDAESLSAMPAPLKSFGKLRGRVQHASCGGVSRILAHTMLDLWGSQRQLQFIKRSVESWMHIGLKMQVTSQSSPLADGPPDDVRKQISNRCNAHALKTITRTIQLALRQPLSQLRVHGGHPSDQGQRTQARAAELTHSGARRAGEREVSGDQP